MRKLARPIIYTLAALIAAGGICLAIWPPFSSAPVKVPRPPYQPPAVTDPKLGSIVNREKKTGERVPPDISSSLPEAKDPKDVSALVAVAMDSKDSDTARNEALNLLRRSGYRDLTQRLLILLGDPKNSPRFRSFCIQHLSMNLTAAGKDERAKIIEALRRYLADKEIKVRRECLLALVRDGDEKGKSTAVSWLISPEGQGARDLAIRCVRELGLKEHIPTVRKHLVDKDVPTRIAAIVALSEWKDEASRPAFEEASKSKTLRIQRAGQAALERLGAKKP